MQRTSPRAWFVTLLLLCAACEPDVDAPPAPPTTVALFDPTASPPVVPTPNDLAFRGGDGVHLAVVDQPTDSAAQRALNAYLRTLDGFPPRSQAITAFTAPVDPATVRPPLGSDAGTVLVIDTQTGAVSSGDQVTVGLADGGTKLVVTPRQALAARHTYAVLVFGGNDPNGVHGADGRAAYASPTFFLLRQPVPLVNAAGASTVRGLDDATAQAAEAERQTLDPLLTRLFQLLPGRNRQDLILAWTFTITSLPMATFDPTNGVVPFPNDVLIDAATGLVNLPIAADDPQAALKTNLNTLDGFSVSAPITVPIDLPAGDALDPATVAPDATVFLRNLDTGPTSLGQPTVVAAPQADGSVALKAQEALESDQDRYLVLLTRGVTDAAGQPVLPPPAMVLLLQSAPLVADGHSTVNAITDEDAAQLEQLRLGLQPLVAQLETAGLPVSAVSMLATFTTQSIARPLVATVSYPSTARSTGLDTSVELTTVADEATLNAQQASLPFPTANLAALVLGQLTSEDVTDHATGRIPFSRTPTVAGVPQADQLAVVPPAQPAPLPIRFWLSLPKLPAATPTPVVILQHGLTSYRGDMIGLADGFAQAGWAAIAIDAPYHGSRSRCTADAQCAGSCDPASGACAGGFVATPLDQDPLACALAAISGDSADCRPVASGAAFFDFNNLFSIRSNGLQFTVDMAQLLRVIGDGANPQGLEAQLAALPGAPALSPTNNAFLGISLGGIGGAVFLAASPAPLVAVLNATGGHDFEELAAGAFAGELGPFLAAQGIQPGTAAYAQLQATADWVFDPIDPFSVGRFLIRTPIGGNPAKRVLQQRIGQDQVILPEFQLAFARELFGADGLAAAPIFPSAVHATLITGQPPDEAAPMRAQALGFVTSGGTVGPTP